MPVGRSAHLPEFADHRNRSGRRVCGICEDSSVEYLETGSGNSGALRGDTRSTGECGTHGAGGRDCGTDRAGYRLRADWVDGDRGGEGLRELHSVCYGDERAAPRHGEDDGRGCGGEDRKSTRLNSSHTVISYAVFCLKKKKRGYCKGAGARNMPWRKELSVAVQGNKVASQGTEEATPRGDSATHTREDSHQVNGLFGR